MNNVPKIGRYLLALPMLVYPPLHFIYPVFVAAIVPPWIPFPLFWTYFTAVAIFAAGVAILFRKYAYWASLLLGTEIFLFVILIHGPLLFHISMYPKEVQGIFGELPNRIINAFKDFGMCGAVFLYAGTEAESWKTKGSNIPFVIGSFILGISITAFGVIHFVYPQYAPGIPPMVPTITFIIPGLLFWVYLTGVILVLDGGTILIGKGTRLMIIWLGIILLAFDLLVWGPRFFTQPSELWGNWLKDIGVIGGVFILADTMPIKSKPLTT